MPTRRDEPTTTRVLPSSPLLHQCKTLPDPSLACPCLHTLPRKLGWAQHLGSTLEPKPPWVGLNTNSLPSCKGREAPSAFSTWDRVFKDRSSFCVHSGESTRELLDSALLEESSGFSLGSKVGGRICGRGEEPQRWRS